MRSFIDDNTLNSATEDALRLGHSAQILNIGNRTQPRSLAPLTGDRIYRQLSVFQHFSVERNCVAQTRIFNIVLVVLALNSGVGFACCWHDDLHLKVLTVALAEQ